MKRIFITGCATGFGAGLARQCLNDGWHVIATDVDVSRLDHLADTGSPHLTVLPLDVRDPVQVKHAAEQAGEVDVLVNNAGYAVFGTIEESDLAAIADMFDVNVMGLSRVTQALLPTLRQRSGTVVNLSSVAGRMAFPESGYYAATKHAVEAISEALYAECAGFGVRVVVIEPGSFDTQFLPTALERSLPRSNESPYAAAQGQWDTVKQAVLEPPQAREAVIDAIVAAVENGLQFQRVVVGPDSARILQAVDQYGRSGFARLLAHHSSGAPVYEQAGDATSPDALNPVLRPRGSK